jgi:hypothetical protein
LGKDRRRREDGGKSGKEVTKRVVGRENNGL